MSIMTVFNYMQTYLHNCFTCIYDLCPYSIWANAIVLSSTCVFTVYCYDKIIHSKKFRMDIIGYGTVNCKESEVIVKWQIISPQFFTTKCWDETTLSCVLSPPTVSAFSVLICG